MEENYICVYKNNIMTLDEKLGIQDGKAVSAVISRGRLIVFYENGFEEFTSSLQILGGKFAPARFFVRTIFEKAVETEIKNGKIRIKDREMLLPQGNFKVECYEGRVDLSFME